MPSFPARLLPLFALLAAPAGVRAQEPGGAPASRPALPIVRALRIEGEKRCAEADLVAALRVKVGEPLDLDQLDRGVEEVWRAFRARLSVLPNELPDGIELVVQVVEIPVDLEPRFIGNVQIDSKQLLEWARLAETSQLYVSDAPRVRERLLQGYHQQGFYFVDVRIVEREPEIVDGQERAADVIFEILEGPRVKVKDVVLHGNHVFESGGGLLSTGGLKDLAEVHLDASPYFGFFRDDFVEEDLQADLLAMRQVYRERGYLDAVVELQKLEFDDERELVTIHVAIDEGQPYTVADFALRGVRPTGEFGPDGEPELVPEDLVFDAAELRKLCRLAPGSAYDQRTVDRDRIALRDYFGERGHIAHDSLPPGDGWEFEKPELVVDPAQHKLSVVYRISQGREQTIRELLFTGAEHTQDRVMRRLVNVFPGERASLKEIQRGLNRLRGTGYFTDPMHPDAVPEPSFRFKDTGTPGVKDLEYLLEEGEVMGYGFSIAAGGGYGVFGTISATLHNVDISDLPDSHTPWGIFEEMSDKLAFHGAGQELMLVVQPGTQFSRFQARFREPDIFQRHIDRISLEVSAQKVLFRRTLYDEDRDEQELEFGRQLSQDASVSIGYTRAIIDLHDIDTGGEPTLGNPLAVPELLKDQEGEHDLSHLRLGFRYRTLNAPINPTEGDLLHVGLSFYDEALGSDFRFVELELGGERYGTFGDPRQGARPSWRLAFEAGVSLPYGSTEHTPYTERFFLGGARTMRGFDYHGVGPSQNGDAVGGQTKLYASAEYRYPLVKQTLPDGEHEQQIVQGRVFVDAGLLDPDSFAADLAEARVSVGFGFYLTVPLPIGLTFGFPLISQDDDRMQVFNFGIGAF